MIKKLPVILHGVFLFLIFSFSFCLATSFAQTPEELEFNLDLNSPVVNLP